MVVPRSVIAAVTVLALLAVRPAAACRCPRSSTGAEARAADAVFVGTVERLATDGTGAATVRVRGVWKGAVAAAVTVHGTSTLCRMGFAAGAEVVFMAKEDHGRFTVRECDGSGLTSAARERALTMRLGAPRAPLP